MSDETYNGWTNRATWLVNLHLSNDEGLYRDVLTLAEAQYRQPVPGDLLDVFGDDPDRVERYRVSMVGSVLSDYVRDLVVPEDTPGGLLATDLILTTLGAVDWDEIAEGWVSDVREAA